MAANRTNTEQFMIRLPDGMRERLKSEAEKNGRSANAEIVQRLDYSFEHPLEAFDDLELRLRQTIDHLKYLEMRDAEKKHEISHYKNRAAELESEVANLRIGVSDAEKRREQLREAQTALELKSIDIMIMETELSHLRRDNEYLKSQLRDAVIQKETLDELRSTIESAKRVMNNFAKQYPEIPSPTFDDIKDDAP